MARWGATAPLIIHSIELREIRLPLVHFFETSFGRTTERRIILVRVTTPDGTEGWGECTAGEGPFYSEEWTETAWATLKGFLAPAIVDHELENAAAVFDLMRRVRGHRMAKAAIEQLVGIWRQSAPACRCGNIWAGASPSFRVEYRLVFRIRRKRFCKKSKKNWLPVISASRSKSNLGGMWILYGEYASTSRRSV